MRKMREGEPMINFTVGPVQASQEILEIGAEQVPYFRTKEFSEIMFENERLMKKFVNASEAARVVFITGSGSASMESVIINFFDIRDKVLVVNGGSFGQRFVDLCKIYNLNYEEIKLKAGQPLTVDALCQYNGKGFTGFLVNLCETSTGVFYDLKMISEFCQENGLFLVVDSISSFLADPFDMHDLKVDVMITGSQKALACPPGVSIITLEQKALERLEKYPSKCMYLDLKNALKNGERGQTPFTPAVGILRQINKRLNQIEIDGGVIEENNRIAKLATYFRENIKDLPFKIFSSSLSNAVTPLYPTTCSAYDIFLKLKDEYGIWVCPNGGALADKVFRVGHIGNLSNKDYDVLIEALKDLQRREII